MSLIQAVTKRSMIPKWVFETNFGHGYGHGYSYGIGNVYGNGDGYGTRDAEDIV